MATTTREARCKGVCPCRPYWPRCVEIDVGITAFLSSPPPLPPSFAFCLMRRAHQGKFLNFSFLSLDSSVPPRQFGTSEKNYQDEVGEGEEGGMEGGEAFAQPPLPPLGAPGSFPFEIKEETSERGREEGKGLSTDYTQQREVVMPKQQGVEQHREYTPKATFPLPLPPSFPPPPPGTWSNCPGPRHPLPPFPPRPQHLFRPFLLRSRGPPVVWLFLRP